MCIRDRSNTVQGEGKWIGFVLDTGESSIIGLSVDTGNGWYAFTAVSYTHLDVYKRQV